MPKEFISENKKISKILNEKGWRCSFDSFDNLRGAKKTYENGNKVHIWEIRDGWQSALLTKDGYTNHFSDFLRLRNNPHPTIFDAVEYCDKIYK